MAIELKAGHNSGPVTVEICHISDGRQTRKSVMFEQDEFDCVSMDFEEIDRLIAYLKEQQEKLR